MPTGTIVKYFDDRFFGFIRPSDGAKDIFVHLNDLKAGGIHNPREMMMVHYEISEGRNGKPRAANLKPGRPPPMLPPSEDKGVGSDVKWLRDENLAKHI
jgi:CspA family cold shock protein